MNVAKYMLLLLASAAAVGASQARAQTNAPAGASAPPAADLPSTVTEVVVTAEKRTESQVNVPISLAVESSSALAKADVSNVAGLQQLVPGFTMTAAGADSQPNIRGVGTQVAGPGLPSNVAIYQDGFYEPNAVTNNLAFPDISSVEVLKGPQGELYGQNATGGAVLVTTRDPLFAPHADISVSYRSFNDVRAGLFVTGPISSDLAGSFSFYAKDSDGYNKNIVTGRTGLHSSDYAERAKLLYKPTDGLSFELAVEHIDIKDPNVYLFDDYQGISIGALRGGQVASKPYEYSNDFEPAFTTALTDISFKANAELPWGTLTSLTHGQWQHNYSAYDVDGSSLPIEHVSFPGTDNNELQEFDLASKGDGRLQWLTGLFLYHDDGFENLYVLSPNPVKAVEGGVVTNSVALFGDITYNIFSKLYVTAGVRYSNDWLKETFGSAGTVPSFALTSASTTFHAITPRAVLRYQLSDKSNVYFSYSAGYKTGGYNANGLSTAAVQPEKIDAFEVGYKVAGRRWDLQAATYYYNYSNLQVSAYQGPVTTLVNAAKARIYGAEVSGSWRLLDDFTANAGLSYTNGTYVSFPGAPHYTWSPKTGILVAPGDASGNPLVNSPEFTAKISGTYDHPLYYGSFELTGNVAYQTTVYYDAFKATKQTPYAVANLRASWIAPDKRWTVSLFVDNIGDQAYVRSIFQQPVAFSESYAPPRTIGFELALHL